MLQKAEHGIDLQPVGFAVEAAQRVIGAEDVVTSRRPGITWFALAGSLRGGFGRKPAFSAAGLAGAAFCGDFGMAAI